jgi:hypothetical protein
MNHALLVELQGLRAYPSVTVLLNTTPNVVFSPAYTAAANRMLDTVDRRLNGDVAPDVHQTVIAALSDLIDEQQTQPCTQAIALCVSPEYSAALRLGRPVSERVVIDDTFATRDLVADLNRTALYRVVTISDRKARVLVGDRRRLVEERNDNWPLDRDTDLSAAMWTRRVNEQLRAEEARHPLPTVIAGVQRSIRGIVEPGMFRSVGVVPGNHDRSSWMGLHTAAWPLVSDWLRTDQTRAMEQLDSAISAHRYAGGIDEIWPLANEGRVELLVVEDDYQLAARLDDNHQLQPTDDREAADVNDDVVDDTIEAVLRHGGQAVFVGDGVLDDHQRIAAILRY